MRRNCPKPEDLRSGINIEHGLNEELSASHIRSDLASNAVNVATTIDNVRKIARIICMFPVKRRYSAELCLIRKSYKYSPVA